VIPIYIVSRATERMSTPGILAASGVNHFVVVDDSVQAARVRKVSDFCHPLVCPCSDLVAKRNWITKYHKEMHERGQESGPWYIGMDDNIQAFTTVRSDYYDNDTVRADDGNNWRPVFNCETDPWIYINELNKMCKQMSEINAPYGGVATMENPFFRMKKYSYRRFVKTKVFIMDASANMMFKHSMCHDSYMTALAIARNGLVLVNNFLFYKARWYEKGGIGDRKAREAAGLLTQLQECCDEFPGLVAMARGKNSALRVCKVHDTSIDKWRKEHGWL